MEFVVMFFLQILLLFFLSRELTKSLSAAIFRLTKNKAFTIYALAIFFLPGVVVHELAHLITANILFVRTGEIEFFPALKGHEVKLGSVAIEKTDLIRRFLIGAAPIIVGLLILLGSVYYFLTADSLIVRAIELNNALKIAINILVLYVLFAISNTMFSSKKDIEGALELFLIIAFLLLLLYILGVRVPSISPNAILTPEIIDFIKKSNLALTIPIIIDGAVITLIKIITKQQK